MKIITVPGCVRCKNVRSFLKNRFDNLESFNLYKLLLDRRAFEDLLAGYDLSGLAASFSIQPDAAALISLFEKNPSLFPRPCVLAEKEDAENSCFSETVTYLKNSECLSQCPQNLLCLEKNKTGSAVVLFEKMS